MKFKRHIISSIIFLLILLIYFSDISLAQCSMCRKVANDGINANSIGAGLNTGILYLLAIPYILVGLFFRKQIASFVRGLIKK
jgi:hypothetical protein